MSKLHDDLINEIEPHDSISRLLLGIADRIEASQGDAVKLSDLCTILREDPAKVSKAVLANTPEGVRQGVDTADDQPEQAPA